MHPAQTKDIAAGRRWGKTVLGGVAVSNVLRQHGHSAWVVPTYKNGRALWRWLRTTFGPLAAAKVVDISESERVITTHMGGFFGMYSGDNIDAIRSEWFNLVVEDEAARLKDGADADAIDPTLADAGGQKLRISTPKGLNWWYAECMRRSDEHAFFHAPTASNPLPNIRRAADLARGRVPERTYRQEWLAEFVTDGAYFQNVDACAVLTVPDRPEQHAGHTIAAGLDWGLTSDYTVLTVICRECSRVVDWWRSTGGEYIGQRERIKALYHLWNVRDLLPERNSMGQPNIEMLRADGISVALGPDNNYGWFMTASNKPALIERLALALEHGEVQVPREYAAELRAFEVKTRDAGHTAYSAPDGMHDDCVVSLALAWHAASTGAQVWI